MLRKIWLLLILLVFAAEIEPATAENSLPLDASSAGSEAQSTPCPDSLIPDFAADQLLCSGQEDADALGQVRSVTELQDVQPSDWAYQAVKALVEKYGVVSGYSDRNFQGNRSLSRNEFAAVLNQVLTKVEQLFTTGELGRIREDVATIRRLQTSYGNILQGERDRTSTLELLTAKLERQQFSTTTKLNTQLVAALSDGTNARTTVLARIRLTLDTSFSGSDLLRTELEAGTNSGDAISKSQNRGSNLLGTVGLLADGGGLDYVAVPNTVQISKLYYTFRPAKTLVLTVGARLNPRNFIDYNRFANDSLTNFSSSFFMNNPLIVQNQVDRPGGAGAALSWQPSETSPFTVRALYAATDAEQPNAAVNKGGLFGDRNQGSVELEYAFNKNLMTRLQYTAATINGTAINAGGFNFEWALNRQFAVFGRVGVGSYSGLNTALNQTLNLTPFTWAVGGTARNIVIPGSVAGLAIGMPFVEPDLGNATQTNLEAYYSFNLNDRVSFSPALLIVSNPNNRSAGTIWEGVLRLIYAF
ncbi:carbohydrate porin [Phormidium sp. CLA17]|uniref:iron uptake porin n=1 Tax=Leptolyngbya sp. Cla-17 TaxID=2803751 RepID=UPI001491C698|nr:iron uptake porin [Leptolyngbya sp. Cla-17]MBM0741538.1 carbohydrate porin [Leptolyngbya sp. Cla-17]